MRRESDGVKSARGLACMGCGLWPVVCLCTRHSSDHAQSWHNQRRSGGVAQRRSRLQLSPLRTHSAVQITTSLRRVRLLNDLDFSCVAGCGSWHAGWAKVASSKHILAAFISGHCALSSRHRQGQLVEGTPNTRQSVIRFTTIYEEEHGHMTIVGPRNYTVHTHCTYHA